MSTTVTPDDRLGAIAVSVAVSELHWTPDVAPSVMDRIARDAVAYPEHFGSRPRRADPPATLPAETPSASRALGRLAIFGIVLLIIVGLVVFAASVNGAEPSPLADASPSPAVEGAAMEGTAAPTPETDWRGAALALRLGRYLDGLDSPVYITDDGVGGNKGGCLYVVQRGGLVRVFDATSGEELPALLDISNLVAGYGPEQGLLGIAFHPDFATNGRFFVRYTQPTDTLGGTAVLAEYKASPCGTAVRGKNKRPRGKIIYKVSQHYPNGNGGWIGFGPDHYLYVALGDGGGPDPGDPDLVGQSPKGELAKIWRMDVDVPPKGNPYAWPEDNPFGGKKKRGFFPGTWAWGLRDPRHASFDRKTGDLWIGDVGQDDQEIDRIPAGSVKRFKAPDFGWSDIEGDTCRETVASCDPSRYVAPVYAYEKGSLQRGVTGGYVYRGAELPALRGIYLFSDLASGDIWGLDADALAAGEDVSAHLLLQAPTGIVSFGEDDDGELYVVGLDGSISRIGVEGP